MFWKLKHICKLLTAFPKTRGGGAGNFKLWKALQVDLVVGWRGAFLARGGEEKKVKEREEEVRFLNAGLRLQDAALRGMYQEKPEANLSPRLSMKWAILESPRDSKFPLNSVNHTFSSMLELKTGIGNEIHPPTSKWKQRVRSCD